MLYYEVASLIKALVLHCDVRMPDCFGHEFCETVKEGAEVEKISYGRCSRDGRIILESLKLGNGEESLGLNTCTLGTGLN